jgi:predicted ATPase
MISLIEVLNYRCLRYVRQPLGGFHVLVGPNASGKTTFLDAVSFLSDLVADGLDEAVRKRTQNLQDLAWSRAGTGFEIAVESPIPEDRRRLLAEENQRFDTIRYEVSIGSDPQTAETIIRREQGFLTLPSPPPPQRLLFPNPEIAPETITSPRRSGGSKALFSKIPGGNDNFYAEAYAKEGRWAPAFKLGPRKSTLGNLPEDESKFPVSSWFKQLLGGGVERITLNSQEMRRPSPPGQQVGFKPDGSNLPWVVERLRSTNPNQFQEWLEHVRTALADIEDIRTVLRPEDNHRYLVLVYRGGLEVPSWTASDGTLRLLALTLPAYLEDFRGIYLIEEPENGIHPRAVETVCQSLSSVYEGQILVATHSPVILSMVDPKDVLCFAKTPEGATDIVSGSQHPKLKDWKKEVNFGVLFAAGVLG